MRLELQTITVEYLIDFYKNARKEDLKEAEIASGSPFGSTPLATLDDAYALVDLDTNEVYAIGGYVPYEQTNVWLVWCLCTDRVTQHPLSFLRASKRIYKKWKEKADYLYNIVWSENTQHIEWLKWLGATILKNQTVKIDNHTFYSFFL